MLSWYADGVQSELETSLNRSTWLRSAGRSTLLREKTKRNRTDRRQSQINERFDYHDHYLSLSRYEWKTHHNCPLIILMWPTNLTYMLWTKFDEPKYCWIGKKKQDAQVKKNLMHRQQLQGCQQCKETGMKYLNHSIMNDARNVEDSGLNDFCSFMTFTFIMQNKCMLY